MESEQQGMTELLSRIPLFEGLTRDECRQVLAMCKQAKFPAGKAIYAAGTPGKELLVILKGEVTIQVPGGGTVAELQAIDTVGEMEICSAQPRVARVVASGQVSGLTLGRAELESLFSHKPQLGIKILKNIVESLSRKLALSNQQASQKKQD